MTAHAFELARAAHEVLHRSGPGSSRAVALRGTGQADEHFVAIDHCENVVSGEILKWSIIGIGININQTLFPTALKNPVSLKQITGSTFNVIDMAKELCDHLEVRWQQTLQMSNDELMKEYCSHLYKRDEQVTFKNSNEIFTAVVRGVTRRGELLLEKNEGIVAYSSIEWL